MTQPLSPEELDKRARARADRELQRRRRAADRSWEAAFITALLMYGRVTTACKRTGIPRATAYDHKDLFEDFAGAWEEALDLYTDALVMEAHKRAVDGTIEPVFYKGEIVGARTNYSDSLLRMLIEQRDPSFRNNHHRIDLANADNKPLEISDPERQQARAELMQWQKNMIEQLTNGAALIGIPEEPPA